MVYMTLWTSGYHVRRSDHLQGQQESGGHQRETQCQSENQWQYTARNGINSIGPVRPPVLRRLPGFFMEELCLTKVSKKLNRSIMLAVLLHYFDCNGGLLSSVDWAGNCCNRSGACSWYRRPERVQGCFLQCYWAEWCWTGSGILAGS